MSVKQQLVETVQTLPESVTLEEAIERIYRAFKLKQQMSPESPPRAAVPSGFAAWLGKARGNGENPAPRFASDEDLWR